MEVEQHLISKTEQPDTDSSVLKVPESNDSLYNEVPKTNPEKKSEEVQKKEMVIDVHVTSNHDGNDNKKINEDYESNKNMHNDKSEKELENEKTKPPEINVDHNSEYMELNSIIKDFNNTTAKEAIVSSTPKSQEKSNTARNSKEERHVWIYNINPSTTAGQLKHDLSKNGKVLVAKIVTNGDRYFGYALMERNEHVKACIDKLNNKLVDGFLLEVSGDPPNKRKVETLKDNKKGTPIKKLEIKKEKRTTPRKSRKRSRSQDPLTLKVHSGRHRPTRSDSHSRVKQREREEKAAFLKKQRELELQLENEKRKLENEKRKLEREKLEFARMQRKLREDREHERRREEQRKKELSRRSSPSITRKRMQVESSRKRASTPNLRPNDFRIDYKENSSGSLTRPKSAYRYDAPPPPRLTTDDKADPWKISLDSNKSSRDYYRDSFAESENKERAYQQTGYNDRKRYKDSSYERKYPESEKKKRYETKTPSCRSEVFLVSSRNTPQLINNADNLSRRFDNLVYPEQQNRGYMATNPPEFQTMQHINAPAFQTWSRPTYTNMTIKPFHHEQERYSEYANRHPYFNSGRKY